VTVYVADGNPLVQRLVSVVKMATVLEEFTAEEQRFVGQKDSVQRTFIKKYFLFTAGSVCCVKLFTTGWQTFR
jgi:hypothetical protein